MISPVSTGEPAGKGLLVFSGSFRNIHRINGTTQYRFGQHAVVLRIEPNVDTRRHWHARQKHVDTQTR